MPKFDAVIFDLDGTLANTLTDLCESLNAACAHFGYPTHTQKEHLKYVNTGAYDFVRSALPENSRDKDNVGRVFAWYREYYDKHFLDHTVPYEGMTEVIDAFAKSGVKTGILTNKIQSCTISVIEKFFGLDKFGAIQGNVESLPPKPELPMTESIFRQLGADPKTDKIAMVGDSDVDFMTARNAGITAVSVTWGYRTREFLEGLKPDMIFDNPRELLTLLG